MSILITDDELRYTLLTLEELFAAEDDDSCEDIVGQLLMRGAGKTCDIDYDCIDSEVTKELLDSVTTDIILLLNDIEPELDLLRSVLGDKFYHDGIRNDLIPLVSKQLEPLLIKEELSISAYEMWLTTFIEDACI